MKSLTNDPYKIKLRCFRCERSMQALADEIKLRIGKCKLAALSRAMGQEVKTENDLLILQTADAVLKEWEAED